MAEYHEPADELPAATRDFHRAARSLIEEIEAVDWYQQRIELAPDPELRAILQHNRDEELEHAALLLEWLRRRMPELDGQLRKYLFTEGPITAHGESAQQTAPVPAAAGDLRIGSLRAS